LIEKGVLDMISDDGMPLDVGIWLNHVPGFVKVAFNDKTK